MGLVCRLSLSNHSDSGSFLVMHALLSQDGSNEKDSGRLVGHVDWCLLLVGGGPLVPCSLPGTPVLKQLMRMVTQVLGQGGRFQSACFP